MTGFTYCGRTLLLAIALVAVLPAWSQPGRFEGAWQADFIGSTGLPRSGTVTVQGQAGQWDMDTRSRDNPCVGLAAPIAVRSDGPEGLTFDIQRSKVIPGCSDTVMRLVADGADTLTGTLNKRPLRLVRLAASVARPPSPEDVRPSAVAPTTTTTTESRSPPVGGTTAARPAPVRIEMIYFGGNDCPPCVAWRGVELPKLQKMDVFRAVTFTHVYKTVMSTVPSESFLPDQIKPYKAKLDAASGFNRGSAQTAIVVDGEVFDYYYGARSAEDIQQRLSALQRGGAYPFERCLELRNGYNATRGQCARAVPPS